MNDILNRGFVSPFIDFHFANGSVLDTQPPRYFVSFKQTRTAKEACSFTLTLSYAPGYAQEEKATTIHKLLLSSVQEPVTYRYGYRTPGGGLQIQDRTYSGIFVEFQESLSSDGILTYTITGIAHAIEDTGAIFNIKSFFGMFNPYMLYQPSHFVDLLTDPTNINNNTGLREVFQNYRRYIDTTDESMPFDKILKIENGTIRDIFCGKANIDNTINPDGFASLSYRLLDDQDILSSGLLSSDDLRLVGEYGRESSTYSIINRYASSSTLNTYLHNSDYYATREAMNAYQHVKKMPFVCFFDNVVDSVESTGKGTFNYLPKMGRQITNIYYYNYGNNFPDSDVISFDATYEGAKALASIGALSNVSSNIDANGQHISSSYIISQPNGFKKNTYSTLSGLMESSVLTDTMIADALDYAFKATMTVVGQTECNDLMDTIRVNVFVNGIEHPGMSGDYSIIGIEDNISDNGFTTTFELVKTMKLLVSDSELPASVSNEVDADGNQSQAAQNQEKLTNTNT